MNDPSMNHVRESLIQHLDSLEEHLHPSYEAFTSLALKLTGAPIGWISFSTEGEHRLKVLKGLEIDTDTLRNFCEDTLSQTDEHLYLPSLSESPLYKDHLLVKGSAPIKMFLGVALRVNGDKIGSLNLCWKDITKVGQEFIDLLRTLAAELSKAVERELKLKKLDDLHSCYHKKTRLLIHDLRNPLMAITGYFSLMTSEKNRPNKETYDKWMGSCIKNAELMKTLIEEFN